MENGKLDTDLLNNMLNKYKGYERVDVKLAGKLGEDCTFIEIENKILAVSSDPVTAAGTNIGKIAFNINMNDLSTSGAEGIGLMITILLPTGTAYEKVIEIMEEIHLEALKHKMQILGGHTEVTDAVNRIIVSVTVLGIVEKGKEITSSGLRVGDSLYVSKKLGIEGTLIILNDFKNKIIDLKIKDIEILKDKLKESLSVSEEGKIGGKIGVNSMHDITEGGILGAVYEVVVGSNKGCIIYEEKLPYLEETIRIAEKLKINPYKLISSGSMLIGTDKEEEIEKEFKNKGIDITKIGEVIEKDLYFIRKNGEKEIIAPPSKDEIYKLYESMEG